MCECSHHALKRVSISSFVTLASISNIVILIAFTHDELLCDVELM